MLGVSRLETARQRDERQRHDGRREGDVRDQDREVERPHESLTGKRHGPHLRVIDEITHQEQRRGRERRDHEPAMLLDAAGADVHVRNQKQDAGDGIQRRVDSGKIGDGHQLSALGY